MAQTGRKSVVERKGISQPDWNPNMTDSKNESLAERTSMSSLMGARDDRKVTPGITELSRPRVHIDRTICSF